MKAHNNEKARPVDKTERPEKKRSALIGHFEGHFRLVFVLVVVVVVAVVLAVAVMVVWESVDWHGGDGAAARSRGGGGA